MTSDDKLKLRGRLSKPALFYKITDNTVMI